QAETHWGVLGQPRFVVTARDGSISVQVGGTHVPSKHTELPRQSTLDVHPVCPSPHKPRQVPPQPSPLSTSAHVFWLQVVWQAQSPHGAITAPQDTVPEVQMAGQHTLTLPNPK